jgi:hypothetical protein
LRGHGRAYLLRLPYSGSFYRKLELGQEDYFTLWLFERGDL